MWGVQRRYKNNSPDQEDFVNRMVDFVKAPSLEKAIHDEVVGQMGVMPAMPLPDVMLKKIASYIFEEQFAPPCDHWRVAVERAEARGNPEHAAKDRRQLKRYCN